MAAGERKCVAFWVQRSRWLSSVGHPQPIDHPDLTQKIGQTRRPRDFFSRGLTHPSLDRTADSNRTNAAAAILAADRRWHDAAITKTLTVR